MNHTCAPNWRAQSVTNTKAARAASDPSIATRIRRNTAAPPKPGPFLQPVWTSSEHQQNRLIHELSIHTHVRINSHTMNAVDYPVQRRPELDLLKARRECS
jgi:hypothetical protein